MSLAYLEHVKNLSLIAKRIASGTKPKAPTLAILTGVCERQVARYIKTLRDEFNAPLPNARDTNDGYSFSRSWDFEAALVKWIRHKTS
jgi:hypothetical protein